MEYKDILSEVLAIAKAKSACADQYRRAAKSESLEALGQVLKDNFSWCCEAQLLTAETVTRWGLSAIGIYTNVDVDSAFLIASGSSTVRASGSSTVRAYGYSTVRASGSSTVTAYGYSTVRAYDSSTVRASGSSTVTAYGYSTVTACDSSTVRAYGYSTVRAYDSSTVRASGSSYINSYSVIECNIEGDAILRYQGRITTATGVVHQFGQTKAV
jgi:hypothetical protein